MEFSYAWCILILFTISFLLHNILSICDEDRQKSISGVTIWGGPTFVLLINSIVAFLIFQSRDRLSSSDSISVMIIVLLMISALFYIAWRVGFSVYFPLSLFCATYGMWMEDEQIIYIFLLPIVMVGEYILMVMFNYVRKYHFQYKISGVNNNTKLFHQFLIKDRLMVGYCEKDLHQMYASRCGLYVVTACIIILCVGTFLCDYVLISQICFWIAIFHFIICFKLNYRIQRVTFNELVNNEGMLIYFLPLLLYVLCLIFLVVFSRMIVDMTIIGGVIAVVLLVGIFYVVRMACLKHIYLWFPVSMCYMFCWMPSIAIGGVVGLLFHTIAPILIGAMEYVLTLVLNVDSKKEVYNVKKENLRNSGTNND